MNKKILAGVLAGASIATSLNAAAQSSMGVGYGYAGGDGVSFSSVALDFAGRFNDNFGMAITTHVGGSDQGADLDYLAAAKLRGGIPVGNASFMYLTAGFGRVQLSGPGGSASENGGLVGAGFETFSEDGKWGFGFEYTTGTSDFDGLDAGNFTIRYKL
jgi:hypothetical protein